MRSQCAGKRALCGLLILMLCLVGCGSRKGTVGENKTVKDNKTVKENQDTAKLDTKNQIAENQDEKNEISENSESKKEEAEPSTPTHEMVTLLDSSLEEGL